LDPNIFRCTVRFRLGTSKCQFGFKVRDVVSNDNSEQDVAEAMQSALHDAVVGQLTTNDAVESWDAALLGGDTGYSLPEVAGGGTVGYDAAAAEPGFMAACIALKSEIRKRYGQGRLFFPLVHEGSVSGDVLSANGVSGVTAFVTAMTDNFIGSVIGHDLLLVNAHDVIPAHGQIGTPGYHPEIPRQWYDVLSLRLNTVVTSLRSRKAGVGS
jgi:hypothetical protein